MTSYYTQSNAQQLYNGLPDPRYDLDQGAVSDPESAPNSVPLPNDDFEPFLTDYADYDAALEQSLSIQELSIGHSLPAAVPQDETAAHHIAKFAENSEYGLAPPPVFLSSSPTKSVYGGDLTPRGHHVPMGYDLPPSSPPSQQSSPLMMRRVQQSSLDMPLGISNISLSPPPRMAPMMPQTPPDGALLRVPVYPQSSPIRPSALFRVPEDYDDQLPCSSPPPPPSNLFADQSPVLLGSSPSKHVEWQPILTVPQNRKCEEIIRSQIKSTLKKTRRKSCLPPGAVDEYIGPGDENDVFQCLYPHCGRLFRRRYNLRSHIQTHLCDRPYACDVCDATFVRPHDLRRHQRCHSTTRPFVCACGKGFTRMDALQRHRQRNICEGGMAKGGVHYLNNSPTLESSDPENSN